MKRLILKSGTTQYKNQLYEASHGEVDMKRWLYSQLKAFHLDPSDDCCETYVPPIGTVDTDTRLTNPHVVGSNMVFDLLNVIDNTTTSNFISIPLSSLNINTTLVDNGNGTATYTNESGVATTITLGLPETPLTATDSNTITFTSSGTANHTLIADVKLNNTGNVNLTSTVTGIKADVIIPPDINTAINNTIIGKKIADYTSETGTITNINETVTTLVNNPNGSMVYTNENGIAVDTPAPSVFSWSLLGNTATTPGVSFIGTTDSQPLVFKTNNIEKLRLTVGGRLDFSNTVGGGSNLFVEAGNDSASGIGNTGVGFANLVSLTSGSYNTAFGMQTLSNLSSGSQNVSIGYLSMQLGTTCSGGTAIGTSSQRYIHNTATAWTNNNVSIGLESVRGNSATVATNTFNRNVGLGVRTLSDIQTGNDNIAIGFQTATLISTGSNNTIIGSNSGSTLTTASNNTIIGANITSLSAGLLNNIIISDGSGNIRISSDDLGRIGIGTTIPTEKLHVVGNIIATGTITPSDIRIKENILDTVHGLKEINLLQPKTYNIKSESQTGTDYTKERIGFLAQDIETVFGTKAITEYDHMYSEPQLVSLKDYDNYNDSEYIKRIDIQNIYEDIPFVENGVPMTKKELVSTVTNYYIDGIKGLKSPDQMYIIASLVNAVKELNQQLIDLKSVNNLL